MTPWTAAYQAPPSMGFSRQEYWSGLPLPSPRLQLGYKLKKKTKRMQRGIGMVYIYQVSEVAGKVLLLDLDENTKV